MTALTLPRLHWGDRNASQKALMVHGLGSSAQTCWQVMEALADNGWSATAIDLRGHGQAPRASRYRIADFALDLRHTHPEPVGPWDLVIGHSIGAASAVVASTEDPDWSQRLVLLDPALALDHTTTQMVLDNQRAGHVHQTVADVEALNPGWHPLDVEIKVDAHRAASLYALEHAVFDNDPWDVTYAAQALRIPTHILGGEPDLGSMFYGDYAKALLADNSQLSYELIAGAGHSVHRDRPHETIQAILAWIA